MVKLNGRGEAFIAAAIGSTGSGKSYWVKSQVREAAPSRLLVWDPQEEYGGLDFGKIYTDRLALIRAVAKAPTFRAIYRPGDKLSQYGPRFDWFCRLVYALGNCTAIFEELADVTEPSRAPDSWSVITRKGRHKALRVYATSQRPAKVDKDFFGNATLIHCGRLNYAEDQRVMAAVLGVPPAKLAGLPDKAFIERNVLTGAISEGKL